MLSALFAVSPIAFFFNIGTVHYHLALRIVVISLITCLGAFDIQLRIFTCFAHGFSVQ